MTAACKQSVGLVTPVTKREKYMKKILFFILVRGTCHFRRGRVTREP